MAEAESDRREQDKKQLVIDTVKAGLNATGLDISNFLDQLSSYIDDTITFVNGMKKAKENKELNK